MARENHTLTPLNISQFVDIVFDKNVSKQWGRRYLYKINFTPKTQRSKQTGYEHDTQFYVNKAKIWFASNFKKFKNLDPNKVLSIDFTYNSQTIGRPTSWSPKGCKQPKKKKGYTVH